MNVVTIFSSTYEPFMFRRLSAPTSGSIRRRARERRQAEQTRAEGERIAREKRERRAREKLEQQRKVPIYVDTCTYTYSKTCIPRY